MSNTERRDLLVELGLEDSIVFENPDYDSAIIGKSIHRNLLHFHMLTNKR